MTINPKEVLKGYDGNELTINIENNGKVTQKLLTALDAIVTSINTSYEGEVKTAEMITKITGLSMKFYQSNDKVSLTPDDIIFVTERVLKAVQYNIFNPIVYGRISELLTQTPLSQENQPN